jgi:ribosome-associated protein
MPREIPIRGETIRLGQLLKLAGLIDSGSDARALLAVQPALVNGEPETRRGRQLHPGDVVLLADEQLHVVAQADAPPAD